MKKQEFLGFAILHFAVWGKRAKQAVQILFFVCFSKNIWKSKPDTEEINSLLQALWEVTRNEGQNTQQFCFTGW